MAAAGMTDQLVEGINSEWDLSSLDNLAWALGAEWIGNSKHELPELTDHPVARWFYLPEARPGLILLDDIIGNLRSHIGFADRRRRLRFDPIGFEETLAELQFASWLIKEEVDFELTSSGPDFRLKLNPEDDLLVEVTSPRRMAYQRDLFERLIFVARRFGLELKLDTGDESQQKASLGLVDAKAVVEAIVIELRSTTGTRRRKPRFNFQFLNTNVRGKPSIEAEVSLSQSAGPIAAFSVFATIIEAANKKVDQFRVEETNILAISTVQLPDMAWGRFREQLRLRSEFPELLDWTSIPDRIVAIILFSSGRFDPAPYELVFLRNPLATRTLSEKQSDLIGRLFPNPTFSDQGELPPPRLF